MFIRADISKEKSVIKTLSHLDITFIVTLYNTIGEKLNNYNRIYPMSFKSLEEVAVTPKNLIRLIQKSSFDTQAKWFYIKDDKIKTEPYFSEIICQLCEYLIESGDKPYIPDLEENLKNDFIEYTHFEICDRYTKAEITDIVENANADFLIDDWNDILIDIFDNVIGICPLCKSVIYADTKHEYIYETGKTEYCCEVCENPIYV